MPVTDVEKSALTAENQETPSPREYWSEVAEALSPNSGGQQATTIADIEFRWQFLNGLWQDRRWVFEAIYVGLLTLIAFWLRINDIELAPYGVHGDEALFGLDALNIKNAGNRELWMPSALGNPSGYAWIIAAMFTIGDVDVTWLRMGSILSGTLLVPASYMLVRQVLGRDVALISVFLIACSSWLIFQSRVAYQMITVVLFLVVSLYFLHEAVKRRDILIAIIGGIIFGASIYIFKVSLIYFALISATILMLTYFPNELRRRKEVYIFLIVTLIVAAPLLLLYVEMEFLVVQAGSLYNEPTFELSELAKRSVELVLHVVNPVNDGGPDGVPGASFLNIFGSLAFAIGLATAFRFIGSRSYQLLLIIYLIAMIPSILFPEAESRRYLFGILLTLIIASIGMRSLIIAALVAIKFYIADLNQTTRSSKLYAHPHLSILATGIILISFMTFYLHTNLQHYDQYKYSEGGSDWYFDADLYDAMKLADDLGVNRVVSFSQRRVPDQRTELLFPDISVIDAANQDDDPQPVAAELVDGDTAFLFYPGYEDRLEEVEAIFPGHSRIDRYNTDANYRPEKVFWYSAYIVREDSIGSTAE